MTRRPTNIVASVRAKLLAGAHQRSEDFNEGVSYFRPYPEYKDSGVEWLGKIPRDWKAIRLRYVTEANPTKSEVRQLAAETSVSFVPMEAVGEYGGLILDAVRPLDAVLDGYTYFRDGDVIVAKITPCFENGKGALANGLENGIAFGTTELHVLRPLGSIDARFLFYLTTSHHFRKIGASEMYGAGGQKRVPDDFARNLVHPIPSDSEQRAIAAFLDRETDRIDALIEKKERLIELLQEERTALITRAVTKGLDPDAPMKDSGVEWMGEIPAHWEVTRMKHISPRQSVGLVINPSTYVDEEGSVPFFFGSDVARFRIEVEKARRITEESNKALSQSMLRSGDLVTVRVGYPGITAVVPPHLDRSNCASMMIVRRHSSFASHWLCYAMNSRIGDYQVELVQYGAAQKQFNIAHAVEFIFPIPPLIEQEDLVVYLNSQRRGIDALIAKIREAIDRLKEYRAALISAAVTGKIDVRSA